MRHLLKRRQPEHANCSPSRLHHPELLATAVIVRTRSSRTTSVSNWHNPSRLSGQKFAKDLPGFIDVRDINLPAGAMSLRPLH